MQEKAIQILKNSQTRNRPQSINQIHEAKEDTITLDIRRTFQNHEYFKREKSQKEIEKVIRNLLLKVGKGYVQGMNFWISSLYFHCSSRPLCDKLVSFIYRNLELEEVYKFKYASHVEVFSKLLKLYLLEVSELIVHCKIDIDIIMLDYLFTLCLNKVPLEHTAEMLEGLIKHGWFFFYRLIIVLFRGIFQSNASMIREKNMDKKFEFLCLIKSYGKD